MTTLLVSKVQMVSQRTSLKILLELTRDIKLLDCCLRSSLGSSITSDVQSKPNNIYVHTGTIDIGKDGIKLKHASHPSLIFYSYSLYSEQNQQKCTHELKITFAYGFKHYVWPLQIQKKTSKISHNLHI